MSKSDFTTSAFPALFIVSTDSYTDLDAAPGPDAVRDVIIDALNDLGWSGADLLRDIYQDEVEIFHETPPTPPYDAVATVVEFTQIPTDMRPFGVTDPLDQCLDALYAHHSNIEIWIDAVSHPHPSPTNSQT